MPQGGTIECAAYLPAQSAVCWHEISGKATIPAVLLFISETMIIFIVLTRFKRNERIRLPGFIHVVAEGGALHDFTCMRNLKL